MRKLTIFLFLSLFLTGCANKTQQNNSMNLKGKKILMVIAPIDFRDAEYNEPRKIFEQNGVEVKVASIQAGTSIGAEGTKVEIDFIVSQIKVEEYDAVAFIGGPGMAEIVNDDSLKMLAKRFYDAGKLTTAICVAPSILAKIGILSGKNATAWSGSRDDLEAGGAVYTGEAVTTDGDIITADGPGSAKMYAQKIIEKLAALN